MKRYMVWLVVFYLWTFIIGPMVVIAIVVNNYPPLLGIVIYCFLSGLSFYQSFNNMT